MKTKILRVSLLILAFSLVIGAAVAMAISANGTADAPEIISQNIEYNENFSLLYAVSKSSVTNPANLVLKVYNKDPNKNNDAAVIRTYDYNSEYDKTAAETNLGVDIYVFKTDGVAATAMLKEVYAQAVETIDGTEYKSAVKKYSVAEYLYERLATDGITANQGSFYNNTIQFGASAQKVVGKVTDSNERITNYRYVKVENGTIGDTGYATGVYPIGTELTVAKNVAENADAWGHYYYNSSLIPKSEAVEGNIITVKDSLLNLISFGTPTLAKLGVNDLDHLSAGGEYTVAKYGQSTDGIFGAPTIAATYSLVEDSERGIVANFTLKGNGNRPMILRNNTLFSEKEATAYECSFDLKVDMPSWDSLTEDAFRLLFYNQDNQDLNYGCYLYIKHTKETDPVTGEEKVKQTICSTDSLTVDGNQAIDTYTNEMAIFDEDGWCHVRVVVYAGSNIGYVYFNGSETYGTYFYLNKATDGVSNYNNDITSIEGISFLMYYKQYVLDENNEVKLNSNGSVFEVANNNINDTQIYLDNIFCGYTKAVK